METTFTHKYVKGQTVYFRTENTVTEATVDRVICEDVMHRAHNKVQSYK